MQTVPRGQSRSGVPTYQAALLCVAALCAIGYSVYAHHAKTEAQNTLAATETARDTAQASLKALQTSSLAQINTLSKDLESTKGVLSVNQDALSHCRSALEQAAQDLATARKQLAYYQTTAGWRTKSAWDRLAKGMSESQVQDILGSAPESTTPTTGIKQSPLAGVPKTNPDFVWFYPSKDPSAGSVTFDTRTRTVQDWRMPSSFR